MIEQSFLTFYAKTIARNDKWQVLLQLIFPQTFLLQYFDLRILAHYVRKLLITFFLNSLIFNL